jgi:hypothetical protein
MTARTIGDASSFTCTPTRCTTSSATSRQRHAPLLERLPAWTIRIVVPAHLKGAVQDLQKLAWGQLASPLKEPMYLDRMRIFQNLTVNP